LRFFSVALVSHRIAVLRAIPRKFCTDQFSVRVLKGEITFRARLFL